MSFIGTAPSLITFHQIQNTAAPGCCWHWPPTCGCQEVQYFRCGCLQHFPSGLWDVFQVDHCPRYGTWCGSSWDQRASWALILQWLNWKSGKWWKMLVPRMFFWFHRLSYADTTCIALLQDTHHFTVLLLLIWLLALELALNIGQNSRVNQHFPSFSIMFTIKIVIWVVYSWI